jgi:hypothetical protein
MESMTSIQQTENHPTALKRIEIKDSNSVRFVNSFLDFEIGLEVKTKPIGSASSHRLYSERIEKR